MDLSHFSACRGIICAEKGVILCMMRRILSLCLLLAGMTAAAQTTAQQYADRQKDSGPLKGAVWGVLARDASGNTLVEYNSGQRMLPASNMKLVTTGAALHALGPEYRYQTRLGYTGTLREDGTLVGDLYIIGGGDPTLGARDSIALNADALFWKWKSLLKEAGIQRIEGRIIGDGRSFEGNLEHESWSYNDTGTYYGTGGNSLCFYGNALDLQVRASALGEPVKVTQTYPETPWMHFSNYSITGPSGTGNSLYLYTTDLAPYSELRGSFATDRPSKTEHFANKFGALTCAYYFWKNLRSTGWEVTGGYADVDRNGYIRGADFVPVEKAGTPVIAGATESPALKQIVRQTNVRSDNFYAEMIYRTLGDAATELALYDSSYVAVKEVFLDLGLNLEDIGLKDGSGLSRQDTVTPEWMVSFLEAMEKSPAFDAFLSSLPRPGEGTLSGMLSGVPGSSRIRMKSGSMEGTLCYSGYILDTSGRPGITFSFLTNNTTARQADVRAVLSRLLTLLLE